MFKSIKIIIKLVFAGFILILSTTAAIALFFAPWVPTKKKDLDRILKLAKPKKGQLVYELGCGDGRFCVALGKKTKAIITGVELSFFYYLFSWIKITALNLSERIKIRWGNFFNVNLAEADVIFFYLTPKVARKLSYKLEKELKKDAKIISYAYKIPGWQPSIIDKPNSKDTPIYVYEIGRGLKGFV